MNLEGMKMKESAENYLETILVLEGTLDKIRSIDVVKATGFSKPSISIALKKLKNTGYIEFGSNGEILLTGLGRKQANAVLERHNVLIKAFLSFGVSEEVAEEDACRVEHVISDETFQKMKEYVNSLENK